MYLTLLAVTVLCLSLLVAAVFSCLLFVQSAHPSLLGPLIQLLLYDDDKPLGTKDEVLPQ